MTVLIMIIYNTKQINKIKFSMALTATHRQEHHDKTFVPKDETTVKVFQTAFKATIFTLAGAVLGYTLTSGIISAIATERILIFSGIYSSFILGGIIGFFSNAAINLKKTSIQEKIAALSSGIISIIGICIYAAKIVSLAFKIPLFPLWPFLVAAIIAIPIIIAISISIGTSFGYLANKYLNNK